MKKLLFLLIVSISVLTAQASFAKGTTDIQIDGEVRSLAAYNIKDNNYFKLRDIANVLKNSNAPFDVTWNESMKAIEIISNTKYSTDEQISETVFSNPVAYSNSQPIYKDGARIIMAAYNIEGNNYFKLRDIGAALDFGVDYNAEKGLIEINTSKGYEFPAATPGVVTLNPEYLSLIGKTNGEIKGMFGDGYFWREFALMEYNNGIMVSYNCYDFPEDPLTDDKNAYCIVVPVEKLLLNCPDSLTSQQVIDMFPYASAEYSEFEECDIIYAENCGTRYTFYPENGVVSSTSNCFVKPVDIGAPAFTETIYINN